MGREQRHAQQPVDDDFDWWDEAAEPAVRWQDDDDDWEDDEVEVQRLVVIEPALPVAGMEPGRWISRSRTGGSVDELGKPGQDRVEAALLLERAPAPVIEAPLAEDVDDLEPDDSSDLLDEVADFNSLLEEEGLYADEESYFSDEEDDGAVYAREGEVVPVTYRCGGCGEENETLLDMDAGYSQTYTEDCAVCCRPNVVHLDVEFDTLRVSIAASLE